MRKRQAVMHLGCRSIDAVLQALLAERMGDNISVAYAFPSPTVSLLLGGIAIVLLVLLVDELLVLLAVAAGHKLWAAGVAAGRQRFMRHSRLLSQAKQKPSRV
jgi:hypothetical protein